MSCKLQFAKLELTRFGLLFCVLCVLCGESYSAEIEHGVLIRQAPVYLAPDTQSQRLGNPLEPGTEVAIIERSSGGWVHIEPMNKSISGWIFDKGLVRVSTPNGSQIVFGAAANAESEAGRMRGTRGEAAANVAYRLYRMTEELFPNSPLAPEALYRAADVKWQIQRQDVMSRPSAKMQDPLMREQLDEELMRRVMKKYPGTKWDDLAAYHLIDNKLCGDWEGQAKCPVKEAEIYERYAADHPQSPVAAEALYRAATRHAALIDLYKTDEQPKKAEESKSRALLTTQRIISQYAQQGDWPARALALAMLVDQGIPTYGTVGIE
ncbi:MAG: SH3 domain-containing protein [Terriglobales bacterium]|jgi:hypothetical protein